MPILNVTDVEATLAWFGKLGSFKQFRWDADDPAAPPNFGGLRRLRETRRAVDAVTYAATLGGNQAATPASATERACRSVAVATLARDEGQASAGAQSAPIAAPASVESSSTLPLSRSMQLSGAHG